MAKGRNRRNNRRINQNHKNNLNILQKTVEAEENLNENQIYNFVNIGQQKNYESEKICCDQIVQNNRCEIINRNDVNEDQVGDVNEKILGCESVAENMCTMLKFNENSNETTSDLRDTSSVDYAEFVKQIVLEKYKKPNTVNQIIVATVPPAASTESSPPIDVGSINLIDFNDQPATTMGQPSSKSNPTENQEQRLIVDEEEKDEFFEVSDTASSNIMLPNFSELLETANNETILIDSTDLMCNSDLGLEVRGELDIKNSVSVHEIQELDDNDESVEDDNNNNSNNDDCGCDDPNNNSVINNFCNSVVIDEDRLLFDLRAELKELKHHSPIKFSHTDNKNCEDVKVTSVEVYNSDENKDAFSNFKYDDSETENDLKNPLKSIIRAKFDCGISRSKKRVTFVKGLISLPDVVESTGQNGTLNHTSSDDDSDNEDDESLEEEEEVEEEESEEDEESESEEEEEEEDELEDANGLLPDQPNVNIQDDDEEHSESISDSLSEIRPRPIIEEPSSTEEEHLNDDSDDDISFEKLDATTDQMITLEMRDLVNQEARFTSQIEVIEKQKQNAELKIDHLQSKISDLEKEHSIKEWNVERLQGELIAACKECEALRRRLKNLDEELTTIRIKGTDAEQDWNLKYNEVVVKYVDTEETLKDLRKLCSGLQMQLIEAQSEVETLKKDKEKLIEEREEEQKNIQETLNQAFQEKNETELKWKKEFEQLRNYNSDREEHLLEDCEWQLRNMNKSCKEKIELAEKAKEEALSRSLLIEQQANEKYNQVSHLRSNETEVNQLRGLTNEQQDSINSLQSKIEELKIELHAAKEKAETEVENMRKLKYRCEQAIIDNQRYTQQKIEVETMEIACHWEEKLLSQMTRLSNELNQIHGEERNKAVEEVKIECQKELDKMREEYKLMQETLQNEIDSLRIALKGKKQELEDAHTTADAKLMQARMFLARTEHDHQRELDRGIEVRDQMIEELNAKHEFEKSDLEVQFKQRLDGVKDEFATKLKNTTVELTDRHKKEMQKLQQKLVREREEANRELERRHKRELEEAETRYRDQETAHQRNVDELKSSNKMERAILEQRDHQNNKEIETLHRKCRCLTNLFEEMRVRYERRDPRPEDLREISELRNRCEQQETDLRKLTNELREYQLLQQRFQEQESQKSPKISRKNSPRKAQQQQIPKISSIIEEEPEEVEAV